MDIQGRFYDVVCKVLLDGNVHNITEIHAAAKNVLGLSREQSAGRILQLVKHGQIIHVDRSMYCLPDSSEEYMRIGISNAVWSILRRLDSLTKDIYVSTHEMFSLTEADWEAVKLLKEINNMVQPVIAAHEVKEESADEQKDSTSN